MSDFSQAFEAEPAPNSGISGGQVSPIQSPTVPEPPREFKPFDFVGDLFDRLSSSVSTIQQAGRNTEDARNNVNLKQEWDRQTTALADNEQTRRASLAMDLVKRRMGEFKAQLIGDQRFDQHADMYEAFGHELYNDVIETAGLTSEGQALFQGLFSKYAQEDYVKVRTEAMTSSNQMATDAAEARLAAFIDDEYADPNYSTKLYDMLAMEIEQGILHSSLFEEKYRAGIQSAERSRVFDTLSQLSTQGIGDVPENLQFLTDKRRAYGGFIAEKYLMHQDENGAFTLLPWMDSQERRSMLVDIRADAEHSVGVDRRLNAVEQNAMLEILYSQLENRSLTEKEINRYAVGGNGVFEHNLDPKDAHLLYGLLKDQQAPPEVSQAQRDIWKFNTADFLNSQMHIHYKGPEDTKRAFTILRNMYIAGEIGAEGFDTASRQVREWAKDQTVGKVEDLKAQLGEELDAQGVPHTDAMLEQIIYPEVINQFGLFATPTETVGELAKKIEVAGAKTAENHSVLLGQYYGGNQDRRTYLLDFVEKFPSWSSGVHELIDIETDLGILDVGRIMKRIYGKTRASDLEYDNPNMIGDPAEFKDISAGGFRRFEQIIAAPATGMLYDPEVQAAWNRVFTTDAVDENGDPVVLTMQDLYGRLSEDVFVSWTRSLSYIPSGRWRDEDNGTRIFEYQEYDGAPYKEAIVHPDLHENVTVSELNDWQTSQIGYVMTTAEQASLASLGDGAVAEVIDSASGGTFQMVFHNGRWTDFQDWKPNVRPMALAPGETMHRLVVVDPATGEVAWQLRNMKLNPATGKAEIINEDR